MANRISELRIIGLHGHRDVTVPILENRLILVGENGAGKTTVLNILYYFLSQQWNRLARYRFKSIMLSFEGEVVEVRSDQLESAQFVYEVPTRIRRYFSPAKTDLPATRTGPHRRIVSAGQSERNGEVCGGA